MRGHDAVMNALPYYFNYSVAKAAVAMGLHCADLGGNTEIVQKQKTLHAAAQKQKVSVIPDCGLAPGMVNIIAAEGIRRVGDAEIVKIFVGGLPQKPEPPLNYQIVYSLEGALDYYTHRRGDGTPDLYENTKPVEVSGYLTDKITQRAVGFVDRHATTPFFLEVAYNAVHWPFQPPGMSASELHGPPQPSAARLFAPC